MKKNVMDYPENSMREKSSETDRFKIKKETCWISGKKGSAQERMFNTTRLSKVNM